jgi:hypothetical protein
MTRMKTNLLAIWTGVALVCLLAIPAYSQSGDPLAKAPAWQPPNPDEVRAQAFAWLQKSQAVPSAGHENTLPNDQAALAKATELWSNVPQQPSGTQLLDCLAATFALADEEAAGLVELCSRPKSQLLLPSQPWLTDPQTPPFVANNMRLLYGRWLVHEALFDEALVQLTGLSPGDVVAPACLLFYQGVVHHKLLNKDEGLKALDQLLAGAEQSPRRYVEVARLMQQDLQSLQDDTLDHIGRRMDDIRRRLDLGRAGPKVRKIEDGVIESLDKLIKKIEEQQQQQQQSSSGSSNNIRSTSPAPDSQIIGGKGRGEVTKRGIGAESGWGDLPPKEREEVLQQIGREFPSHYRDVIEQYFRRLAAEGSE